MPKRKQRRLAYAGELRVTGFDYDPVLLRRLSDIHSNKRCSDSARRFLCQRQYDCLFRWRQRFERIVTFPIVAPSQNVLLVEKNAVFPTERKALPGYPAMTQRHKPPRDNPPARTNIQRQQLFAKPREFLRRFGNAGFPSAAFTGLNGSFYKKRQAKFLDSLPSLADIEKNKTLWRQFLKISIGAVELLRIQMFFWGVEQANTFLQRGLVDCLIPMRGRNIAEPHAQRFFVLNRDAHNFCTSEG